MSNKKSMANHRVKAKSLISVISSIYGKYNYIALNNYENMKVYNFDEIERNGQEIFNEICRIREVIFGDENEKIFKFNESDFDFPCDTVQAIKYCDYLDSYYYAYGSPQKFKTTINIMRTMFHSDLPGYHEYNWGFE